MGLSIGRDDMNTFKVSFFIAAGVRLIAKIKRPAFLTDLASSSLLTAMGATSPLSSTSSAFHLGTPIESMILTSATVALLIFRFCCSSWPLISAIKRFIKSRFTKQFHGVKATEDDKVNSYYQSVPQFCVAEAVPPTQQHRLRHLQGM
jgi:hypothetical protein